MELHNLGAIATPSEYDLITEWYASERVDTALPQIDVNGCDAKEGKMNGATFRYFSHSTDSLPTYLRGSQLHISLRPR